MCWGFFLFNIYSTKEREILAQNCNEVIKYVVLSTGSIQMILLF